MKEKLSNILDTGKKKAGIITVGTVLALTLGVTAAFAANTATDGKLGELLKLDNGIASYSTDGGQTWTEGMPAGGEFHYSLDDGKTWGEGLPPEGSGEKSLVVNGPIPDGTENANSMTVRNVDGVVQYSTDGGKTWSSTAPDGSNTTVNPDGSMSFGYQKSEI